MTTTTRALLAAACTFLLLNGSAFAQTRAALISDVDNPARNFVQLSFIAAGNGGSSIVHDAQYVVPAGKRLVVDTISAMSLQTNGTRATRGLQLQQGPNAASCALIRSLETVVFLPLAFQGTNFFGDPMYGGLGQVQVYVDTGRCLAVRLDLTAIADPGVQYQVTLSGHLVSVP